MLRGRDDIPQPRCTDDVIHTLTLEPSGNSRPVRPAQRSLPSDHFVQGSVITAVSRTSLSSRKPSLDTITEDIYVCR